MKTLLLLFLTLLSLSATAEYRAYQYYVKSKYNFPHKSTAYLITSALSPTTYISYHGGNEVISVNLVRTWICKGHTGNKNICPGPASTAFID